MLLVREGVVVVPDAKETRQGEDVDKVAVG